MFPCQNVKDNVISQGVIIYVPYNPGLGLKGTVEGEMGYTILNKQLHSILCFYKKSTFKNYNINTI